MSTHQHIPPPFESSYLSLDVEEVMQPNAETVLRFVYASRSRIAGSVYAELERIRDVSLAKNAALSVNTALLHQSGWFLQWQEGPPEVLVPLVKRVAKDPRHEGMRVLHYSTGPRQLPEPWTMGIVQKMEKSTDFEDRVERLRVEFRAGKQYSPASIWRKTSVPVKLRASCEGGIDYPQLRVMVCSAHTSDAHAFVTWLGETTGEQVMLHRYAGVGSADVASTYLDCIVGGLVVRVTAMARHGLQIGLVRALIPDVSYIAVLLAGDEEKDADVMRRIGMSCIHSAKSPKVLGITLRHDGHAQPQAIAHRANLQYEACGVYEKPRYPKVWEQIEGHIARHGNVAASFFPVERPAQTIDSKGLSQART